MNQLQTIQSKIYEIRGQRVMLDRDLAELYQVETRVLNQAVKRNIERFPEDFMFQLTEEEWQILKSQIVISSWGGIRKLPYAFTEQGVAMLSSVL
ncbi:MAG: ORF6N domain-containing protein, partial [Odoribacter sp.]|nr:ORF6N domain-containing protein [Odoribacter sp.]